MSDFDVLIIGGYSLAESWSAGERYRDEMRLSYGNHPATLNYIKHFVRSNGRLAEAELKFQQENSSRLVSRSLNTIYLSSVLAKHGISSESVGYFVHEQERFRQLMACKPKVVAISTTFIPEAREIARIAQAARDLCHETKIVVGGIKVLKSYKKMGLFKQGYFTDFDVSGMKKDNFFFDRELDESIDALVIEECGELTLVELVRAIKENRDYRNTPNIAYHKAGDLVFTNRVPEPYSFDDNPIDWGTVPRDQIGQEIPVRAGMGCPFKCAFCDFVGLHKLKLRTVETVIDELKRIQNAFPGISVFFTDDNLFTNSKRTRVLAEAIIASGLKFRWRAFFRVDAITDENIDTLAKSGCSSAFLGVESGDDTILASMKKHATRTQALRAVQLLSDLGINSLSFIIVGFPGETSDTVNNTIELLNSYPQTKVPIHQYYPMSLLMFPLSPLVSPENRKRWRIEGGTHHWSHLTMDSDHAREELLRLFREVTVPVLPYLEYIDPEIPYSKLHDVVKTRENIVKTGINVIDESNAQQVYEQFKKVVS